MTRTLLTESTDEAAEVIRGGGVVAFPTETVYGLGANAFDEEAVARIFEAKGRPSDNPLIVHVASTREVGLVAGEISPLARRLMEAFFPGPLTLVLPKKPALSKKVTAGLNTVGVRMPRHFTAHKFLADCGVPLAAPSANLSGRPSPTTWEAVKEDLYGRVDCILIGEPTQVGLESTVLDCTAEPPEILRAGAVTLEQLRQVVPETRLAKARDRNAPVASPGLKYAHYAPRAQVRLVDAMGEIVPSKESAFIGLTPPPAESRFGMTLTFSSVEEYARNLFSFFRACDAAGMRTVYCQRVGKTGIGLALMDRLERAALS